jgi:transcriptional regulator with XRE-family HTH domain
MNNERIEKFLALVSEGTSDFEKKALWRKANKAWLRRSTAIAIKVHSEIIHQGISQKAFSERLGVSAQYITKILKGNENLSLDTISKLETALGIQLIEVVAVSKSINYNVPENIQPETTGFSKISKVIPFQLNVYTVIEPSVGDIKSA